VSRWERKSRTPTKGVEGKREEKWAVITWMLIKSKPSRRDAMYGPRRVKSSFRGEMRSKSLAEMRVRVNVGFMTPPGSRLPEKLRGVENGDAIFSMTKCDENPIRSEYVDAQGACTAGGRRSPRR
jgi:hypothetical protein